MEINRNNYEIYVLDYIEGNLPLGIREDFESFLDKNPDLKIEINDFEEINLEPVSVSFFPKGLLKKDPGKDMVGLSKFEQLTISAIENEIKQDELKELNEILTSSPDKHKEFQIFQKAKLIPDLSIIYPSKNHLKHKYSTARIKMLFYYTSIAASIVLVLGIAVLYQSPKIKIKGKALSYQTHLQKHEIRPVQNTQTINYKFHDLIAENIQINSVIQIIDSLPIDYINSRQLASIENNEFNKSDIEISNITHYSLLSNNISDKDFMTVKEFFNKQLKEKILKQPVDDKITFVSVGKALSRGLSKILRKDIKLDEKVMKDGSKLYAFKAGSIEIYANAKPSKKADHNSNDKNQNKLNSQKE